MRIDANPTRITNGVNVPLGLERILVEDIGVAFEYSKIVFLFSSQRMVYLIADLLNVSRLKTGKFIIGI